LRVAVLGYGAIGKRVVEALEGGEIPGTSLAAVFRSTPGSVTPGGMTVQVLNDQHIAEQIENADLVVEAAGVESVAAYAPAILRAGKNILLTSIGALADPSLRNTLKSSDAGKYFLTEGAIGGLNLLGAASKGHDGDRVQEVVLTTTKKADTLIQPWMETAQAETLRTTQKALTIYSGSVEEAIKLFPRSLNVACALAEATDMWAKTQVNLVADPSADLTNHRIEASGKSGTYSFDITNHPLAENPTSSGLVAEAIIQGISRIADAHGKFV